MQINITIEASSGAELRQALLELTGSNGTFIALSDFGKGTPEVKSMVDGLVPSDDFKEKQAELQATLDNSANGKKRRTKAEIEAEKTAADNTAKQDVPPADDAQPQVGASEVPAETKTETPAATEGAVDLKEVQTMAANWIRKGPVYKEKVMGFLNKYKTDPAAALRIQDLTPEQLAEFFEGIKTITE